MPDYILVIIFGLLMVPGILRIFFPILPGVPYMYLITIVYVLIDHFHHLSVTSFIILGVIALLDLIIDYFSGIFGAKLGGASKKALGLGTIAFILGTILLPPLGGLIGLFLAIFLVESGRSETKKALKAASAALIGSSAGILLNLILAILFLILFVVLAI